MNDLIEKGKDGRFYERVIMCTHCFKVFPAAGHVKVCESHICEGVQE